MHTFVVTYHNGAQTEVKADECYGRVVGSKIFYELLVKDDATESGYRTVAQLTPGEVSSVIDKDQIEPRKQTPPSRYAG